MAKTEKKQQNYMIPVEIIRLIELKAENDKRSKNQTVILILENYFENVCNSDQEIT